MGIAKNSIFTKLGNKIDLQSRKTLNTWSFNKNNEIEFKYHAEMNKNFTKHIESFIHEWNNSEQTAKKNGFTLMKQENMLIS